MNLSKTEKLLAAKKKLKEFQLQKRLHAQDSSGKQQIANTMNESISQCQTNCQAAEVNKSGDRYNRYETKQLEISCQSENQLNSMNIMHKEENMINHAFSDTNNLTDAMTTKLVTDNSEPVENNFSILENSRNDTVSNESDDKDSTHLHLQPYLQSAENDGRHNLNVTPSNGPLTAHKKQSLEVGSEDANVHDVTDANHSESNLDLDPKSNNQFVNTYMEEQKQIVNELYAQLRHYQSRIIELEEIIATNDSNFEARLVQEINPLKEQLQAHAQTTNILITEKAELMATLVQSQKTARQTTEELTEMHEELKQSQLRIGKLEKELTQTRSNSTDTEKNAQHVQQEYDDLEKKYCELGKEKEDLELEASELKQKLNLKNTEFTNLQQEFQEKAALLSLNELKIQQLTDTSQTLESQHKTVSVLEQKLSQMRDALRMMNNEKEEASKQYQNYVRQLDAQQTKLLSELENRAQIINDLVSRENSYVQRLSDLEQQLQHEREKNETLLSSQDRNDQSSHLMKKIEELMVQQERCNMLLIQKDREIEALTKEIQELEETKDDGADAVKLVQALESEKLGASRAVSQNHQLKQQLTEMENAFVTLSNAKLDLTEQLQAERCIGRKLNAKLNTVEMEMDHLKEKLRERETFLIELEKEKLQNAQIADQIQHYQAQSHHAHTLQQELQNALICIEGLRRENEELSKKLKNKPQEETHSQKESVNGHQSTTVDEQPSDDTATTPLPENTSTLDEFRPITKLEQRFKETMEKVAELTDDKQRLEHLVLQLQGETETIGEYITLYQKQRAILGERWKKREQTFRQLTEQRNQQQEQLHKLKVLVTELLKKHPETLANPMDACVDCQKGSEDIGTEDAEEPPPNEGKDDPELPLVEDKTTSEILDLLTEIKDCKDTCTIEPNFHPCPWCSGRLITV